MWRWQERQSQAHLAEAWLRHPPAGSGAARHIAFAGFLQTDQLVRAGRGRSLPLLADTWAEARRADFAGRVRVALGPPEPPPFFGEDS